MPKVNIGYKEQDERFRSVIKHILVDTPRPRLCRIMDLSDSGLYVHQRHPERVTMRELRALRNAGKITDEQLLSFIRKEA